MHINIYKYVYDYLQLIKPLQ